MPHRPRVLPHAIPSLFFSVLFVVFFFMREPAPEIILFSPFSTRPAAAQRALLYAFADRRCTCGREPARALISRNTTPSGRLPGPPRRTPAAALPLKAASPRGSGRQHRAQRPSPVRAPLPGASAPPRASPGGGGVRRGVSGRSRSKRLPGLCPAAARYALAPAGALAPPRAACLAWRTALLSHWAAFPCATRSGLPQAPVREAPHAVRVAGPRSLRRRALNSPPHGPPGSSLGQPPGAASPFVWRAAGSGAQWRQCTAARCASLTFFRCD